MKHLFLYLLLCLSGFIKAQSLSNDHFCFANAIVFGDSANYSKPIMVDMDNDSKQDLVIYNFDSQKIVVYKNNGVGFNISPLIIFPILAIDIAVGNFDGDNYPDIAVLNDILGHVTLLKNNNGSSFTTTLSIPQPSVVSSGVDNMISIYTKNLGAGYNDDILVFGKKSIVFTPEYYILSNTGAFTFNNPSSIKTMGGASTWLNFPIKQLVVFGDFNGDYYPDFAYSEVGAPTIYFELSTNSYPLSVSTPTSVNITVSGSGGCLSMQSSYYDLNSYADIGYTSNGGFYKLFDPGVSYTTQNIISQPGNIDFSYQDFNNNNGIEDYLSFYKGTGSLPSALQISEGISTNSLTSTVTTFSAASTTTVNSNFVTADVDNNTLPDIIMAGTRSEKGKIRLIKNYSIPVIATANNNGVSCSGSNVLLSASSTNTIAGSYVWSDNSSVNIANTSTTSVTLAGVYHAVFNFTIPNSGGSCALRSNDVVTTTTTGILPIITLATSSNTLCASSSSTLMLTATVVNSSNYYWIYNQFGTAANSSSLSIIIASPQSATVYSFTAQNGGCYATGTISPTVYKIPYVPIQDGIPNFCIGTTGGIIDPLVTVSANNVFTYQWVDVSGVVVSTNSVLPVTTTITATYSLQVFNHGCISNIEPYTVIIKPLPSVSSATVTPKICKGQVANFNDSYTSGYTYQTLSSGSYTNTNNTYTLSPTTTQQYTYTVIDNTTSASCSNNFTYTIVVDTVPTINMVILPSTVICAGQTATLIVNGAQTYTLGTIPISSTTTITPTAIGFYYNTVAGTNGGCPPASLNITINVKPTPTIAIVPLVSNTICSGQSVTLTPQNATTYTLLPANTNSSSYFVLTPTVATITYTINGKDGNGCINKATNQAVQTIIVKPTPTIAVNSATVCAKQTATLIAMGATNYTWTESGGTTASIFSTLVETPGNTVLYSVIGEQNGCVSSSESATITVNPTPNIFVTTSTYSVCPVIETVTLSASSNNGSWNYLWSNGLGTNATAQGTIGFSNVTITLTVSSPSASCSSYTTITIYPKPVPSVSISPNNLTVCQGNSFQLNAIGTGTNYSWKPNNLNGNFITDTINSQKIYTLVATGANSCKNFATTTVNVYNKNNIIVTPSTNNLCVGSTISVSVSNGTITNLSNTFYNSTYTFNVVYGNNCKLDTIIMFNVNSDCSIKPFNAFSPDGNGINDLFYIQGIDNHNNHVSIYDRWGVLLFETEDYKNVTNAWDGKYKGKNLPSGTYFYVIDLKDTNETKKGWVEITGN